MMAAPVNVTHLLTNFLLFISCVKVWNFASIKKIANVLEKRFLFDLHIYHINIVSVMRAIPLLSST